MPTADWRAEASRRAQRAQECLETGDIAGACTWADSAFEALPAEPPADVVLVAVLITGGDVSMSGDDVESAASLYQRASDIGMDLERGEVPESDVTALLSRAFLGLARCNVRQGHRERAAARYLQVLAIFEKLRRNPPPPAVIEQVRAELREIESC